MRIFDYSYAGLAKAGASAQTSTVQTALRLGGGMQITMKFNHNGTHIEGVGLEHEEHRVIININAHNSLEGALWAVRLPRATHIDTALTSCIAAAGGPNPLQTLVMD